MTKKDLKKVKVQLCAGFYGRAEVNIYNENWDIIARIDIPEIQEKLEKIIKAGHFDFSKKGRKYQYLTLK